MLLINLPMKFLFLIFLFLICSFSPEQKTWRAFRINGFAQGSTYSILYYARDSTVTQFQVDSILNSLDSAFSLYKNYSLISRFNQSEKGLQVNEHFKKVFRKSEEVFKETGGLFDITVQPLVQAWGFGVTKTGSLPGDEEIKNLQVCVGSGMLSLNENFLSKSKPCVKIDMNGIAQGYSVDVLAGFLDSKGIKNYLVELGGEIRIRGRKQPRGEKMKIGIESPAMDELENHFLQKIILMGEGAVTTSGNFRRYYESGGKNISHLIHPLTGRPVQNELLSVTVMAPDALTADAVDNALMLMGLEKAMQFVEKRKHLAAYFIFKTKDGTLADTASSRFRKRAGL
jgi:FAD:protein FMN transferase